MIDRIKSFAIFSESNCVLRCKTILTFNYTAWYSLHAANPEPGSVPEELEFLKAELGRRVLISYWFRINRKTVSESERDDVLIKDSVSLHFSY